MRKATALTTFVLLGGFCVLFFLADYALRPLARDGRVGQDLTRHLAHRGDLEAGSKVTLRRVLAKSTEGATAPEKTAETGGAGKTDRAEKGPGLRIYLAPSEGVRKRKNGMLRLAQRVAEAALEAYPGRRLEWVETVLRVDPADSDREARMVLLVTSEGLRAKGPSLPITWPPPPARAAKQPPARPAAEKPAAATPKGA